MGIRIDLFVHRFTFVFYNLIIVGCVLFFLHSFGCALGTGNGAISAVVFAVLVLALGFIIGIVVWRVYICALADRFIEMLISPRTMLDKAPPVLSLAAGMLSVGDISGAEEELRRLASEYPGYPEVALMRFELCCDRLHRTAEALEIAENYFRCSGRRGGGDNFTLLMRCADLYRDGGDPAGILPRLEAEKRRVNFYEAGQIRMIGNRIKSIHNIGNSR